MVLSPLQKLALHVALRTTTASDAQEAVADYLRHYPQDAPALTRLLDVVAASVAQP